MVGMRVLFPEPRAVAVLQMTMPIFLLIWSLKNSFTHLPNRLKAEVSDALGLREAPELCVGVQHGSAGSDETITLGKHLPYTAPGQGADHRGNASQSQPIDRCADIVNDRDIVQHPGDVFVVETAVIQSICGGDFDIGEMACKVPRVEFASIKRAAAPRPGKQNGRCSPKHQVLLPRPCREPSVMYAHRY